MWKLRQSKERGKLVLTLCGRIESELIVELRRIFESKSRDHEVVVDLKEVKLLDRDAVTFLASCEGDGIRLENCPPYIREWIRREKDSLAPNGPND